jgi:hypothetical protein
MATIVKHQFQSAIADDPAAQAAGEVLPSHWNDDHVVTMTGPGLIGRQDAGDGEAQEIAIGANLSLVGGVLSATAGGGGAVIVPITVTLPSGAGRIEHEETIAVAGVTLGQRVMINVAPHDDSDENDETMLDIRSMAARALNGAIRVRMAFGVLTSGPIKLNCQVA